MSLLLTVICALISLIFLWKYFSSNKRRNGKLPPEPKGWPLLGNLPQLNLTSLYKSLAELRQKHGDIFSIRLLNQRIITLNSYEYIKAVFSKAEACDRPKGFPLSAIHQGNYGVIMANGSVWQAQRRFTVYHFKELGMGRSLMEDMVNYETLQLIEEIKKKSDTGKPVQLDETIDVSVFNAIWAMLSGERYDYDDESFRHFCHQVPLMFNQLTIIGGLTMFFPVLSRWIPMKIGRTKLMDFVFSTADQYAFDTVEQHKKRYDENDLKDYVDYYLKEIKDHSGEKDTPFTDWHLISNLTDMFYAGFETAGFTIKWAVGLLAFHLRYQETLHDEIDRIVGHDRAPAASDASKMPFTQAVIAETQRYGSVAPVGAPHIVQSEFVVNGFTIPAGSYIIGNLYGAHRDAKYWKKPDEFYPGNFLKDDGSYWAGKESFVPFSIGKRSCAGEAAAKVQLFLIITSLFQEFSFRLPSDHSFDMTKPAKGKENLRGSPYYEVIIESRTGNSKNCTACSS